MRVVIQRVTEASVTVEGKLISEITNGLLILLGIGENDTETDINWLVKKVSQLRIFPNELGNMNKSVQEIDGEVLVISQFTLYASTKKGNRPSFMHSAKPETAKFMYENFINSLEIKLNKKIKTGIFGADMKVNLTNDGPVTICIDSQNKE